MTDGPLIVQSDKTLLLDIDHPMSVECRRAIAPFAELERSPEHIHTYRLTPLGLWNARAAGHDAEQVIDTLIKYSRYAVPHSILIDVAETMSRYGRLRLEMDPVHGLILITTDTAVLEEVIRAKKIAPLLGARIDAETITVLPSQRGQIKQSLLRLGWPAEDFAGYVDGQAHEISLVQKDWKIRPYQELAAEGFWHGGSGVVVLPCGAGKTIVGAAAMAHAKATTLILVTNTVAARQWRDELLKRTTLNEDEIGEYSGSKKEIRPITIATYQVMTKKKNGVYAHLDLFDSYDWGLIIYDEVHLLNCATTRTKRDVVEALVEKHVDDQVLVIGQYIDQLDELSEVLGAPLIKGETPIKEREILFNKFRSGEIKCLVVSKVANFSIDLPDATIAIQVSGAFGSRQEEAQRLGRILRPKSDGRGAKFYSVISRDTIDQDFAQNRQRFLAEQGYSYKIIDADDVFQGKI